jgi:5-methylcytosine-specific restriction protein A
MMMGAYDRRWRTVRLAVLERDGHRCRMMRPGCTITATTVDHIVELANGGARLDPANLRAACGHCNASSGATMGNAKRLPRSRRWTA